MAIRDVDLIVLVQQDTPIKRVASTKGGEYHGPCTFCGGRDRLIVWPNHPSGHGQFWCRQCGKQGDAISYICLRNDIGRKEARKQLGLLPSSMYPSNSNWEVQKTMQSQSGFTLSERVIAPVQDYQDRGWEFVVYAQEQLLAGKNREPLELLFARGLSEETIVRTMIGFNPKAIRDDTAKWGMDNSGYATIHLPAGIIIPNMSEHAANPGPKLETLWGIRVRHLGTQHSSKYTSVRGSVPALYGADSMVGDKPIVLVEGELDALTIQQQVQEVAAVATGSTSWCRRMRWILLLRQAPMILVAFDSDEAGEKASTWWLDVLGQNASRWCPWWDDANAMHQSGADLRTWLTPALQDLRMDDDG